MVNKVAWSSLINELTSFQAKLVAVSKKKPIEDIKALYDLGQRDFGENYVQELVDKQPLLPRDIYWHYIGHLQRNKVKFIAPFVHLIHAVDSYKLLIEINKEAAKNNRIIDVLLQVHIATEETKFGFEELEIAELFVQIGEEKNSLKHIRICGLMGMASQTNNEQQIKSEFSKLHYLFTTLKLTHFAKYNYFNNCSMGMSNDYKIALDKGSNMVRIGSMLFGVRAY